MPKNIFNFYRGSPSPGESPGEGPDWHLSKEIKGVGPIPAQIREGIIFKFDFGPKRSVVMATTASSKFCGFLVLSMVCFAPRGPREAQ